MDLITQGRTDRLSDTIQRLPRRYQHLVRGVLGRLPAAWYEEPSVSRKSNVVCGIELSEDVLVTPRGCVALASARRERFDSIHCWTVILYRHVLDGFSDQTVLWVIAYEFGHIAARMTVESETGKASPTSGQGPEADEPSHIQFANVAKRCGSDYALVWGFTQEKDAFDREVTIL